MRMTWWRNASSLHKRLMFVAFVFIGLVILLSIGTLVPVSPQEASSTEKQLTSEVKYLKDNGLLVPYIFGNNFMLTLIMFIPFVGPLFGAFVLFNTGTVIAARSVANNVPPLLWVASIFLTPVGWLEFAAYSLAISGSIWLTIRLFQHRMIHELGNTAKFITVSAVILLAGAIIETLLIG